MNFFQFAEDLENYTTDNYLKLLGDDIVADKDIDYKFFLENQWDKGKDGNDVNLPVYSLITEIYYAKLFPPIKPKIAGQPYNLMWTGDMFKLITFDYDFKGNDLTFKVDSTSQSKDELFSTHLKNRDNPYDIFKLNKENNSDFIEIVTNKGIQILNTILKLK